MSTKLGKIIADFQTTLAAKIAVGGTSGTLQSATDSDGVALPTGHYFLTLDGDNASKEHFALTLTGTAITSLMSVSRQGVQTSGAVREHKIGALVTITDFAHIKYINDLLDGTTDLNSAVPLKYDGTATITNANHLATKAYVDATATGTTYINRLVFTGTAGETIAAGQLIYLKISDGRWWLADADTIATVENIILGLAQGAGTAGASITGGVLTYGLDTNQTGLTTDSVYYASNTPGGLSLTAGTTEVTVGYSQSTTSIFFNPRYNQQLTEDQQDALAGNSGSLPNATNKYEDKADTTDGTTVDQSQTTQDATVAIGEADATTKYYKIAQSFVAGLSPIVSVELYKSANTGTYTGDVTIGIFADSGGSPTGAALATVTVANASYNALSTGANTFTFGASYLATLGTTYWVVISSSTGDNSNHPNLGTNSAGGYGSGSVKFNNTTDDWTAIATIDLYFKVNTTLASKLLRLDSSSKLPALDGSQLTSVTASVTGTAYTFGETITAGQPVYFKSSDGLVYKASAASAAEALYNYIGIAIESGTVGQSKKVATANGSTITGLSLGATTATIASTAAVTQSDADYGAGAQFYTGHKTAWGFLSGSTQGNIEKITVSFGPNQGVGAGTATMNIYEVTAYTAANTITVGSSLGSVTITPTPSATNTFTFASPFTIKPNTHYLVEMTASGGSGANYFTINQSDSDAANSFFWNGNSASNTAITEVGVNIPTHTVYTTLTFNYDIGDYIFLGDTAGSFSFVGGTKKFPIGRILSSSSIELGIPEPKNLISTSDIIFKSSIYLLQPVPKNALEMNIQWSYSTTAPSTFYEFFDAKIGKSESQQRTLSSGSGSSAIALTNTWGRGQYSLAISGSSVGTYSITASTISFYK